MKTTRPAALAGSFYPENSNDLSHLVRSLLREAETNIPAPAQHKPLVNALIAPHAGLVYSGPIAASAYHCFSLSKVHIKSVVILAPAHRVYLHGCACPTVDFMESPLGKIALAKEQIESLCKQNLLAYNDEAHQSEHSIEIHLPFLQTLLAEFTLLPVLVGNSDPVSVSNLISRVWSANTLLVISSDLSHFLDYDTATRRDLATSRSIETLDYLSIGPEDACGYMPIAGMLHFARRENLRFLSVDRRNSYDTAGNDKNRVVGYGAYVAINESASDDI